ncbi:MAG TPA: methyltransferase domain-containing protein [Candidatus Bathyarchaeia archaeon]|nr:methyltransferase domain-containing protein [Candidatus Bathyarchaeia archaeon]
MLSPKSTRETEDVRYIPAFSHSFLTPAYDFMMKWAARESAFKPQLIKQARIEPENRVLDVGCGTATLTILLKKTQPKAYVVGLDADLEILGVARQKAANAGVQIALDHGTATELPYSDNSFDRLVSSMVLHHLTRENKARALREAFRVLKPRGELHIADLGKPQNSIMRLASSIIGRLEESSDNVKGLLPEMLHKAGFVQVEETTKYMTIFGTVALYKALKPTKSLQRANSRNLNSGRAHEEESYYSLLRKYAGVLAPYYDTVTLLLSKLRDRVVDLTNARKGSRILDVGTGTGKQAFAFAKRGFDVTGIDLSEDMLKVAKQKSKYENAKFEIANATSLPFEDDNFDVTCVSFALHDMIPTIREKSLREMVRVTKANGTIVIVDYALPKNRISRFLIYHFVKSYEPYYSEFIKSDLEALLRKSGIEIEDRRPVLLGAGRIVKGRKMTDRGVEVTRIYA